MDEVLSQRQSCFDVGLDSDCISFRRQLTHLNRERVLDELIVVLYNSIMIRFCNIDFSLVEQALARKDAATALQARDAIEFEVVDMKVTGPQFDITNILSVSIWRSLSSVSDGIMAVSGKGFHLCPCCLLCLTCNLGSRPVCIWRLSHDGASYLFDSLPGDIIGDEITQIAFDHTGQYLVMLDKTMSISIWSSKTFVKYWFLQNMVLKKHLCSLILLYYYDQFQFQHFSIIPDIEKNKSGNLPLFTICAYSERNHMVYFIEFPSFEISSCFSVLANCLFIEPERHSWSLGLSKESLLYFIELVQSRGYIRCISNVMTDAKLQTLLEQNKYDEALALAAASGIESEVSFSNVVSVTDVIFLSM
jgi:hypothetical protein